ncbi:MAG: ProQ/FINO family protein [Acidiphilium sp.]|nr:ProQ/FINO family protein [Acidiphilium sp.]
MGHDVPTADNNSRGGRAGRVLGVLRAHIPVLARTPPCPLAVGTRQDITALCASSPDLPNLDAAMIDAALSIHTRSLAYLTALAAGGPRYTIFGDERGVVEPCQVNYARVSVERRQRIRFRKKQKGAGKSAKASASSPASSPAPVPEASVVGTPRSARSRHGVVG